MYRRIIRGQIQPGQHATFIAAVREVAEYQQRKGINTQASVWYPTTGKTNCFEIISEFEDMTELQKFDVLVSSDGRFAELRRQVMAQVVFGTAAVEIQLRVL